MWFALCSDIKVFIPDNQKQRTMKVTIPRAANHYGMVNPTITVEISDKCPKCGAKRGVRIWKGRSYDGRHAIEVDCWENECGHIDFYSDVREEYLRSKKKNNVAKEK